MEIFDSHVHAKNTSPDPDRLLSELEQAGVKGCTVFSNRPIEENAVFGTDYQTRLNEVLSWTDGNRDRLFPVLWIHPDEENIIEKIQNAVDNGVMAFKVICNNFYVGETKSMDMLSKIASLNKPVFFHSGILWDGRESSNFNRPANWEALLELDGLKFSLGHCSWPWIDECLALYGKFLNALTTGKTTEMFLDLTPGTPEIYREELLRKIFTIGYDVPNNILYGTDCRTSKYQYEWTKKWLSIDIALFDKYGIPPKMRQKIFRDNLFRFLGITNDKVERFVPLPDSQTIWTPELEK
jgi:predicted TIM-barrel fold metal-dependent hydrolase